MVEDISSLVRPTPLDQGLLASERSPLPPSITTRRERSGSRPSGCLCLERRCRARPRSCAPRSQFHPRTAPSRSSRLRSRLSHVLAPDDHTAAVDVIQPGQVLRADAFLPGGRIRPVSLHNLTENMAMSVPGTDHADSWRVAALIALIGFQLRSIIVGVPPVLPELRVDLHLSFSAIGALTAIPVLGLGVGAVPGALLVNRFGARRVVGASTLGLGLTALLRLAPPLPYSLFIWTAVLALLIAAAQPAIAVLIRNRFPDHIQQTSTIYAMSLGVGGLAGATLSVYLLAFGGWRGTFVIWALLALVAAVVWIWTAPGRGSLHEPMPHGLGRLVRNREVWHVAMLFGGQSLVFYGGTTWIPFLLRGYSHAYLALVLFLFQVVILPLTAILATIHRPWARSPPPYARSRSCACWRSSLINRLIRRLPHPGSRPGTHRAPSRRRRTRARAAARRRREHMPHSSPGSPRRAPDTPSR